MKPYGMKREKELQFVDVGTIIKFGLQSSVGGKDYFNGGRTKKSRVRRVNKTKARQESRRQCKSDEINSYNSEE